MIERSAFIKIFQWRVGEGKGRGEGGEVVGSG